MKLNGALKPRQGASSQGSSPGVVLRKYRDKRYYNENENVVNGLPLNKCGENFNNNYNKNYNNNNNKKEGEREENQKECGEKCSSLFSSSSSTYNNNNSNNTQQNRITSVRGTLAAAENIDYNSHGSEKAPPPPTINHDSNNDIVNLKQKQEQSVNSNNNKNNITTRQVNTKKKHNNNNINKENNNGEKKKTKQEEKEQEQKEQEQLEEKEAAGFFVTKVAITTTTSNNSKYHVTSNKTNNNSNNNKNNNNSNKIFYCKEVNKFLLIPKIYEKLILCALTFVTVIISWLFIQFKLLLFPMFSHTEKETRLTGNPVGGSGGSVVGFRNVVGHNLNNIMRASQSFKESFDRIFCRNVYKSRCLPPSIALCLMVYAAAAILLPQPVVGDDGDNFYPINGLETTTPEFDYASRGQKKFGDKCENTLECGFPGSICDPKKKSCQCTEDLPVTNHFDKCGKEAAVNESCFFNEQCEVKYFQTECRDQRCVCRFDMSPFWLKDGTVECKGRGEKKVERYIDPAMIGVLIGMALMFIIICVVLRLFSQARWRENRTIFNTPNPRLMNVSLLRESKLLHGQERRGSRMSVRAPSRQPSMASLRPHSPNPSLGKTGSRSNSNSHGSNASATSLRSTRSNSVSPAGIVVNNSHHERKGSTYQPHHHHQQQQQHHPHHNQQLSPPPHQPHHQQQKHHQQQHDEQHEQHEQQHEQKQPLTQTNIISNPVAESVTVEIIEPEK